MKESDIQKDIINYLSTVPTNETPIFFFAPLNETAMMIFKMFKIPKNTSSRIINFLKKMGLVPGNPDLCLIYNGRGIFFEVKKPGEVPTDGQKIIHGKIRSCGSAVFVVTSVKEVKDVLETLSII